MTPYGKRAVSVFFVFVFCIVADLFAESVDLQAKINNFFVQLDASFAGIVETGAVRSTSLRPAERLFIREMRKNPVYTEFIRTNSKGVIISDVIRARKIEQPMRDVSNQRWFRHVSVKKESYYTLEKDEERGRYYLFWARPVLKQGDRFIGAIVTRIDLWDSFYEFSNSVYVPFRIRLGRKALFDHKWKKGSEGSEKDITVQGIEKISVIYAAAPEPAAAVSAPPKDTTLAAASATPAPDQGKVQSKPEKKKGGAGILIFLLVLLFIGIGIASFILIAWMRRRAFLKHLDEEEDDL